MDHRRNVGRIGIAITDEALGQAALIDDRFENPPRRCEIGELVLKDRVNPTATSPGSELQEPGVGHIPSTIQELQVARRYRERILSSKFSK